MRTTEYATSPHTTSLSDVDESLPSERPGESHPTRPSNRYANIVTWTLFVSLVVMTLSGVGTLAIVSLLGLAMCVVGLSQSATRIDWWIMAPLLAYVGMNMVSSYAFYHDVVNGYGGVQLVYVSMYALSCCLGPNDARRLRQLCALWACVAATLGIIGFAASSFFVSVTRLAFVVEYPQCPRDFPRARMVRPVHMPARRKV